MCYNLSKYCALWHRDFTDGNMGLVGEPRSIVDDDALLESVMLNPHRYTLVATLEAN